VSDIFDILGIDVLTLLERFTRSFAGPLSILDLVISLVNPFRSSFRDIGGFIQDFIYNALDGLQNFANKFTEGFQNLQNTISEGWGSFWSAIPDIVRGGVNSVIANINEMIRRVADGVNSAIRSLNSFGFQMPSWLGGGSFGLSIPMVTSPPQIPMLARGGIVDRPTLAMIGERGKEAVMPLENNTGWIADLANTIGSVVGAQLAVNRAGMHEYGASLHSRPIQLNIDGVKLAEAVIDDFMEVAGYREVDVWA
jgi:hypothetical protein